MDYDIAFWLETIKTERRNFMIKLSGFYFFSRVYKEIMQKLFQICLNLWKDN